MEYRDEDGNSIGVNVGEIVVGNTNTVAKAEPVFERKIGNDGASTTDRMFRNTEAKVKDDSFSRLNPEWKLENENLKGFSISKKIKMKRVWVYVCPKELYREFNNKFHMQIYNIN